MDGYHKSVLLKEAIEGLRIEYGKWYLDCTLGDGGYTLGILEKGGNVVGIDVDPEAILRANDRLKALGHTGQAVFIQGNFRDVNNLIQSHFVKTKWDEQTEQPISDFAGAIFDLGVSSLQLETPERGFSFGKEGPLDMRMDPALEVKALDLLKIASRKELNELFLKLGEEKNSWKLANALVRAREIKGGAGIETTTDLANFIERTVGGRKEKIHPATRVFQALRIAVNDELKALEEGLEGVFRLIRFGRIVVVSFHSLEDRIVKNTFKKWQALGFGEIITKKPVLPNEAEVAENPRSRSAKMRVFEKNDKKL